MASDTCSPDYFWDFVFLKVESTLFCVPKFHFERASEVFAGMFSLPATNPEGRVKEKPIVLENYKADEFTSLLKVMYPTAKCSISGAAIDLRLDKAEWMNVLKLSTIWNMKEIRDYAIHRLSKDVSLTPFEKIRLARTHRVSKWLEESIATLANPADDSTLEELLSLGDNTAAKILWIQNKALKGPFDKLRFRTDSIRCGSCSSTTSLLSDGDAICRHCSRNLATDEILLYEGAGSNSTASTLDRVVALSSILCNSCSRPAFNHGKHWRLYCASCSNATYNYSSVRVTHNIPADEQLIHRSFSDEINSYRSDSSAAA